MSVSNTIATFVANHKTSIGIASSAAVYIGSIVWTAKGTIKAVRAYDKKCLEMGVDKLTPIDTVKVSAKYYVGPAAGAVIGTTISVATGIAGEKSSSKLLDAAKSAHTVAQIAGEKLEAYKAKAEEVVGTEKAKEIEKNADEAATKQVINNYISNSGKASEYYVAKAKGGDYLYYDQYIGRFFTSDDNTIDSATKVFNAKLEDGEDHELNEFYEELELESVSAGSALYSLTRTGRMKIKKDSMPIPNGNGATCATINFVDILPY